MNINVYPPEQQAVGSFDGGKIIEQKPIGFPREGSVAQRVGPLFYWAWGFVEQEGALGLHPHQGFEIMTYVINGVAEHGDTLGTNSIVTSGGAQVMQAGSGISHKERIVGPKAEMFQIWFEPNLNEAIQRKPTYNQFIHEDFPVASLDHVVVKTVIGRDSPIKLVADVNMWDIHLEAGSEYKHTIPAGYSLAALAIRGGGVWNRSSSAPSSIGHQHKDFIVMEADTEEEIQLLAAGEAEMRIILIQVPTAVTYPLYKR
ncbi:pirin family protein [Paenibacillus agricola]|uniref:Pirin n=1 Tax=Paenibacillus agricola TaxID=2716264 RepID=A0ABX0J304_9BACL|nr:pirin family protein [Paenibacillus agricola]NHN30527.1 pirin [Paenibacillus agricola]